jgi:peptide/nickel transport system permease protein
VPLLLIASALSFVLLSLVSGKPAAVILGPTASAARLRQLSLNARVWVQSWDWLDAAPHGDLGVTAETSVS